METKKKNVKKAKSPPKKKKIDAETSNRRVTRGAYSAEKRTTRSNRKLENDFKSLESLKPKQSVKKIAASKIRKSENEDAPHQSPCKDRDDNAQRTSIHLQKHSSVEITSVAAITEDHPKIDCAPHGDNHATDLNGNIPINDSVEMKQILKELQIVISDDIILTEKIILPPAVPQNLGDEIPISVEYSSINDVDVGKNEENDRRSLQGILEASFSDSEYGLEKNQSVDIQNIEDVINNLDDPELTNGMMDANWENVPSSENHQSVDPPAIHQANSASLDDLQAVISAQETEANDQQNGTQIEEEPDKENNDDSENDDSEDPNDETFNASSQQDDTATSGNFSQSIINETTVSTEASVNLSSNPGPVNTGAIDDQDLFAIPNVSKSKLSFCMYCKKMQTVISRHLETVHRDEPEVKQFSALKKGTYERKQIIETLRNQGNNMYNTDEKYNKTGELLVSRRPKERRSATQYRTCYNCKGCFSKKAIRRHFQRCIGSSSKNKRHNSILSRRIEGRLHEEACERFVRIFSIFREDEITRLIRYDELLIKFGNAMCDKYKRPQQEAMIRNRLRTLGRLLKAMKEVNPDITDFMSIYHPSRYKTMITAVKNLSDFNEDTGEVETSSLAISIGIYITAVGEFLKFLTIEKDDDAHQKLVEKYLFLHKAQYTTRVNRVALEAQAKKHRELKKPLPTTDDIKKLCDYVNENRKEAYKKLQKKFTYEDWLKLLQCSLISIQIFNRRRSGEIERAEINDLKKIEKIDEKTNPDLYKELTEEQKASVSMYCRFIITGKLQRDVPVLLDRGMEACLSLILSYRQNAKVPAKNPYVFGIPGFEDGRLKYLRACPLMRQYANECGAAHPERLRGTYLRKHMATTCAAQNIDENEITDIANFMGHAEAIHRSHYRQSVVSRDVVGVAKLLRSAMGCDSTQVIERGTSDEESIGPPSSRPSVARKVQKKKVAPKRKLNREHETSESSNGSSSDSPTPAKRSRKRSSMQKKKKCSNSETRGKKPKKRWSQEEKDAALHAFGSMIKNNRLPSTNEIKKFLQANPRVERTVDQVRTWASNEKKKWNMD